MISVHGLTKEYRDEAGGTVPVLQGVDLEVAPGEFVAVVGPSGSGKSTLLHILGGLDIDYRGQVAVAGQALTGMNDRALSGFRNTTVGFVFQSFHLVPHLSALENVRLPSAFAQATGSQAGAHGAGVERRAEAVLATVGLLAKKERRPSQLSGGERQRVAIARALFSAPKLLLCDEPTGNLDARTGQEIIDLFRTLNREGLTVLAVTHEERLSAAAGRVLRLREGKLWPEERA